jgi:site-specific DNA recombinase
MKPVRLMNQQTIAECDRKIANYRALLDAGTDPALVAGWIAETTALRATAEAQQRRRQPPTRQARLTRQQIRGLITAVGDLRTAIRRAEAKPAKTALYQQLRVRLTYDPGNNSVQAEADLGPDAVGNGFVPEDQHLPDAYTIPLVGKWQVANAA